MMLSTGKFMKFYIAAGEF